MKHVWGTGKVHTGFLVGRPEGKRPLGRTICRWGIILKRIFKKWDGKTWSGLIWIRTGTGGGHL
jgi:hypothetical protein